MFAVMIITVLTQLGSEYEVPSSEMNEVIGGSLDIDSYETELNNSHENTENLRERFEDGDVNDVDDPSGIFSVAGDIVGIFTTPFNLIAQILKNKFGVPDVFTKVLLAILNILILIGLWSLIRKGD
jgi:hypothetical protein